MKKILIVEDKEMIYEPLATYFKKKRWEVKIAEDGKIALDLLTKGDPEIFSCMLLDLRMNQMDGDELLKKLKRLGITPPRTILLSAYTSGLNILELESLGVLEILGKPCNPAIIEKTADKIRRRSSMQN
jgi:DNA-binding response OmpR family regulator